MPQSSAPLTDNEPAQIVLPRPAINLALRVLQLMSGAQYVELRLVKVDDVLYLLGAGGKLERLG